MFIIVFYYTVFLTFSICPLPHLNFYPTFFLLKKYQTLSKYSRAILHEMFLCCYHCLILHFSPTVCRALTKKNVRVVCVFIVAIFYYYFLVENRNSRKCLSILHGVKVMQVLHVCILFYAYDLTKYYFFFCWLPKSRFL
jgi:hypothetical protein